MMSYLAAGPPLKEAETDPVMDLRGFEPLTSAMRTRRSPN